MMIGWIVVVVSMIIIPTGAAALWFWALLNDIEKGMLAIVLPGVYLMLGVPFLYLLMMFEHWGIIPP